MRIGGLTFKVYLYSMAAVLATVGVFTATVFTLKSAHHHHLILASGHIARDLWWSHQNAGAPRETTIPATRSIQSLVTVYDAGGRLMVSTATPPFPMPSQAQLGQLRDRGFVEIGHALMAHELRERGNTVAIAIVKFQFPSPWRLVWPLFALLAGLLAVAVVFARHLTRPLQRVAKAARAFGQGDLAARVGPGRNDEMGELGRAFDAMADRVSHLMSSQQELMANVSHELRTPLSRMQVAVDLVTDGKVEQIRDLFADIARDLSELERLLDDVMTVAKLDLSRSRAAGPVVPLRVQRLSLETLLGDAVSRFRSQHPGRQLVVDIDQGVPELSADSVLLRRVVDNLLENARKFSDQGTIIRLSARLTHEGVTITVGDRGSGIEPRDLAHVFTPFFRGDRSRSRSTGGVGLGLALARRVVEAHGGRIDIASEPGQGTTVTVALPASAVAV